MNKMRAEDLRGLKHGDKIYRNSGFEFIGLDFVGFMPRNEGYLIFCKGEYLTHLYIGTDDIFRGDWYSGEYDSKFVGKLRIEYLEDRISSAKRIHFKDE
jgi:hypothetical protein